jgi:hypothetical protein
MTDTYRGEPFTLPLTIRASADDEPPIVTLAGVRIENVLAINGVRIRSIDAGGVTLFEVVLRFGPGALDIDVDVDTLRALLAKTEAPRPGQQEGTTP